MFLVSLRHIPVAGFRSRNSSRVACCSTRLHSPSSLRTPGICLPVLQSAASTLQNHISFYLDDRLLFFPRFRFDLEDFKPDVLLPVVWDDFRLADRVDGVFAAASKVVRVEESASVASNAYQISLKISSLSFFLAHGPNANSRLRLGIGCLTSILIAIQATSLT